MVWLAWVMIPLFLWQEQPLIKPCSNSFKIPTVPIKNCSSLCLHANPCLSPSFTRVCCPLVEVTHHASMNWFIKHQSDIEDWSFQNKYYLYACIILMYYFCIICIILYYFYYLYCLLVLFDVWLVISLCSFTWFSDLR